MTQEDRKLLLTDLCARLPYGVIVAYKSRESEGRISLGYGNIGYVAELGRGWWTDCKPYLRPMSSMTEEEKMEFHKILVKSQDCSYENNESATTILNDWYLSKGFDVRGLIPKNLALEALKGMYETEKQ